MLKHFFKTGLQFLKANKVFAIINALGLSIALAVSFIIVVYVVNELSYNHCHKNRDRVFRVNNYYVDFGKIYNGTPYILSSALKEEFPQVQKSVRVRYAGTVRLKCGDAYINAWGPMATDSEIFDIFTLPLVGNQSGQHLLDDQNSIVLTQSLAKKLFPDGNPVGKEVEGIINSESHRFNVTGVFEDIPVNSTFRAGCFVNSKWTIAPMNKSFNITDIDLSWKHDFWTTWVLLSNEQSPSELEGQFRTLEVKNLGEKPDRNYSLQSLSDVYLKSEDVMNSGMRGDMKNIRLFSIIALLIVLTAAINYIILSTAVSSIRAKEIGIRKTFGASSRSIRYQLLSESILLALLVLPIALVMAWFSIPYAEILFQTHLQILTSNLPDYLLWYLSITLFIGVVSGIYTSGYLSRQKVISILKSTARFGKGKLFLRSLLIVAQLVIFCSFITSVLIIRSQYNFMMNSNPGYYNKDVLLIDIDTDFSGYTSYLNSIKSNPEVIMAAGAMEGIPMNGSASMMVPHFQDNNLKVTVEGMAIDFNFLKTMGIRLVEGRYFSEDYGGDLENSVIVNETAIKQLGITDPIGKELIHKTIIGVVKDFNLHSLHSDIPPMVIELNHDYLEQIAVHYKAQTLSTLLPRLKSEWEKQFPDKPFQSSTIEEVSENLYTSEKSLNAIVSFSALFTMLISMFGLFGLTLFMAKTRTKEIGIKKVLGSSEKSIVVSFLWKNMVLVMVAALLSVPLTTYFMNRWLANYAYQTTISWWFFVISFLVATIVVLLTVSIHSIRASRVNPVESLRYE
ncbi:MAG: ABC transporter permease [Bacteroidales bacterium]|nr:ABC transporter permease [Bacteroidales bacterium]